MWTFNIPYYNPPETNRSKLYTHISINYAIDRGYLLLLSLNLRKFLAKIAGLFACSCSLIESRTLQLSAALSLFPAIATKLNNAVGSHRRLAQCVSLFN